MAPVDNVRPASEPGGPKLKLGTPQECRVFLTHKVSALDYSSLDEYAERVYPIYLQSAYPNQPDWSESDGAMRLQHLLEHYKFNPELDYIGLSGDILRIGMVCALIGSLYKTACFLRYDKQIGKYWAFRLDFGRGKSVTIAKG